MSEKRLKFKCYSCNRIYSMLRELEGNPKLTTTCPYCYAEAEIDLSPWRSKTETIHKSGAGDSFTVDVTDLPDVLPTAPKQDDA